MPNCASVYKAAEFKMAFFRIKRIKGKEYIYIVENEWRKKSSRQKVKAYIGRAYRFDLKSNVDFPQYMNAQNIEEYINNNQEGTIIKDLVRWELFKFDISKEEFSIDLNNIKIQKSSKNIVFLINDGFMCGLTLKNLFEFKSQGDEQIDAHSLARAFVEAGIKLPQEVFIGIFGKLYKTTG